MNLLKCLRLRLIAIGVAAALAGCGTVTNATVAGYEANVANNAKAAGQNALNAKIWALCMTPWIDIVNAPGSARAAIRDGCVANDSARESTSMIDAIVLPASK